MKITLRLPIHFSLPDTSQDMRTIVLLCIFVVIAVAQQLATDPNFQDTVVVTGLNNPVDYAFVADGRIFFASKSGIIQVFKNGAVLPTPLVDISAEVQNAGDKVKMILSLPVDIPLTFLKRDCYPSPLTPCLPRMVISTFFTRCFLMAVMRSTHMHPRTIASPGKDNGYLLKQSNRA